jgi:hypothetical protein
MGPDKREETSVPSNGRAELSGAKTGLAESGNWVDRIDTATVTDPDAGSTYYPGTSIVRSRPAMGRDWTSAAGGRTPRISWIVALLSGLSGFAAAGIFMLSAISLAERGFARPLPPRASGMDSDEASITGTTCLILFGTIYLTGDFLYGRLGNKAEQQRVREVRRQHLPLIALLGGVSVACRPILNVVRRAEKPLDWLLLSVGLLILAYAIPGIVNAIRSRVPYTQVMYRR